MASSLLAGLGLLTLLTVVYRIYHFLIIFLVPSQLSRYLYPSPSDTGDQPAWALVTGASDGIGKQIARELARFGFNVVLHGRNPTKLAGVKDELEREFSPEGRAFRVLVADAGAIACINCQGDDAVVGAKPKAVQQPVDFDAITASVSDIHLTVLVNNAGGNPFRPVYQYTHEKPLDQFVATVNLNAVFPLVLISKLLPQLVRSGGPCLIMNIGSLSDIGTPGLSAYSPCKAFLNSVTVGIARELLMLRRQRPGGEGQKDDVEILMIRVGEVCGTVYDKGTPSLFHPSASTMAKACLARVGCGGRLVEGYLPHAVQSALVGMLPEGLMDRVLLGQIGPRWEADVKKKD